MATGDGFPDGSKVGGVLGVEAAFGRLEIVEDAKDGGTAVGVDSATGLVLVAGLVGVLRPVTGVTLLTRGRRTLLPRGRLTTDGVFGPLSSDGRGVV